MIEILGRPELAVRLRKLDGCIQQHLCQGISTHDRRGVQERLECRARLAVRLPRSVELALLEIVPANHCPDIPGARVQNDDRPLVHAQVSAQRLIDPVPERRFSLGLQCHVEGRVDTEPPLIQHFFAVALAQHREDVADEVGSTDADEPGVPLVGEVE